MGKEPKEEMIEEMIIDFAKRLFYHEIYKNPSQSLKEAVVALSPKSMLSEGRHR